MAFHRDILRNYNSLNARQKTRLFLGLGVAGLALAVGVRLAEDSNEIRNNSMPKFASSLEAADPRADVDLTYTEAHPAGSLVLKDNAHKPDCQAEFYLEHEANGNIYVSLDGVDQSPIASNHHGAIRPITSFEDIKQKLYDSFINQCP